MELVEDELLLRHPLPPLVVPDVVRRRDHHRGAVDALGLEARGGVGEGVLAVEAVAVEVARLHALGEVLEVAAADELHLRRGAGGLKQELHRLRVRRPDAEEGAAFTGDRAKGESAGRGHQREGVLEEMRGANGAEPGRPCDVPAGVATSGEHGGSSRRFPLRSFWGRGPLQVSAFGC